MGYRIVIDAPEFSIKAGHDGAVLRHLQAWSAKKVEDATLILAIKRAKTAARAFELLGFTVDVDKSGQLRAITYDGSAETWFFDLDPLWAGIEPHMEPGSAIEITREDDEDGEGPERIVFGDDPDDDD